MHQIFLSRPLHWLSARFPRLFSAPSASSAVKWGLVVARPGCITNLGFLLFSRKFSSRFEFGLSVLISSSVSSVVRFLVFRRAQHFQRQKSFGLCWYTAVLASTGLQMAQYLLPVKGLEAVDFESETLQATSNLCRTQSSTTP